MTLQPTACANCGHGENEHGPNGCVYFHLCKCKGFIVWRCAQCGDVVTDFKVGCATCGYPTYATHAPVPQNAEPREVQPTMTLRWAALRARELTPGWETWDRYDRDAAHECLLILGRMDAPAAQPGARPVATAAEVDNRRRQIADRLAGEFQFYRPGQHEGYKRAPLLDTEEFDVVIAALQSLTPRVGPSVNALDVIAQFDDDRLLEVRDLADRLLRKHGAAT